MARAGSKKPHPKSKFSEEEDNALRYLVSTFGDNDWNQVAQYMPNRSSRQCRERYKLYLSPEVNNGPWSEEDDLLLEKLYKEHGPKWTVIAKHFVARTDVNIKSRWNVIRRRIQRKNEMLQTPHIGLVFGIKPSEHEILPDLADDISISLFDDPFSINFDI